MCVCVCVYVNMYIHFLLVPLFLIMEEVVVSHGFGLSLFLIMLNTLLKDVSEDGLFLTVGNTNGVF